MAISRKSVLLCLLGLALVCQWCQWNHYGYIHELDLMSSFQLFYRLIHNLEHFKHSLVPV